MVMAGIRHTKDTRDPEWCCDFWNNANKSTLHKVRARVMHSTLRIIGFPFIQLVAISFFPVIS